MSGLRAGQSMTSTSCWFKKAAGVTCCMGRVIILDVYKVTSKHPRRPWQHLIPQDLDVPMPAARGHLPMVRTDICLPNRRIICIHRRGAEMKQFVLTIQSSWRSSRGVEIRTLPLMWSAGLSVAVSKFCLCILETPPTSWLLIAENCHLPTTWQFAALFALANFVAWSPLKAQININSLCRNPTLHKSIKTVMARQTSLQVTTPELTFLILFSLSGPQTILTVFGHSIWLLMDRWNQQYFVPQLNMRPETINTDQIHANDI